MRDGIISSSSHVRWAVYGQVDPNDSRVTDWMAPCSDRDGTRGCRTYVAEFADRMGGGGQCIMKKEASPAPPLRPKPDVEAPDAPITPGTQNKDAPNTPGNPNNKDEQENPTRLGQQPKKDDPNAPVNKNKDEDGFAPGAICAFPKTKGGVKEIKDPLPDAAALQKFMPNKPVPGLAKRLVKLRQYLTWDN